MGYFYFLLTWILNTYWRYFLAAIILILTIVVEKILRKVLSKSIDKSSNILRIEKTNYLFFRHFVSLIVYLFGVGFAISVIPALRTFSISIFAGAGVLAVIIGFASQHAFANIVSGLFIIIFKPFRVGDRIKIDTSISGVVLDITLRHTVIKSYENKRIVVPNGLISSKVIENMSLDNQRICKFVEFNITLNSDLDKAMMIMEKEALKHKNCIDNRTDDDKKQKLPQVKVKVLDFVDSGVKLRAWVWTKDPPAAFELGCDLNKSIKEKFEKQGIEIGLPHRVVVLPSDFKEKLRSDIKEN